MESDVAAHDIGGIRVFPAGLRISQLTDPEEAVADRMAEGALGGPGSPARQRGEAGPVARPSQTASASTSPGAARATVDRRQEPTSQPAGLVTERSISLPGGAPLSRQVREYFEPRFGHDFGRVRVHSDRESAEAARALRARAFTVGDDIAFGSGEYAPDDQAGRQLLAHELAHVVQHAGGTSMVSRWGYEIHQQLTNAGAQGTMDDPLFASAVASNANVMDYRVRRVATGVPYLLGIRKGEGPDHGEDGDYSSTDESSARAQNVARQNVYFERAVALDRRANEQRQEGQPVHRIGGTAQEMFLNLGLACHIAQDRGSHWEGVKGRGHDDPRDGQNGWSTDDPSCNGTGYARALENTRQLFRDFRSRREGRGAAPTGEQAS